MAGTFLKKNKYAALFLGWLIPGLGHVYAGKRWAGVVIFVAITAASFTGLALGHFRNVYFATDHWPFLAEVGNGLFVLVTSAAAKITSTVPIERTTDGGYLAHILPIADLYLMVAGLLNFVTAANAFDLVAHGEGGKEC